MKLGQKIVSVIGMFALLLGITASIVAAQTSTSHMELALNVQCLDRTDVTISGNGAMQTALQGNSNTSTTNPVSNLATTNPNAINVKVNVGCYMGAWTVNADVTNFRNGTGAGADSIDGDRLTLLPGPVSSYYNGSGEVLGFGDPLAPRAHIGDFGSSTAPGGSADDIFHTQRLFLFIGPFPVGSALQRAPWTSNAQYTGQLDLTGETLEEGTYSARLTVELVLEDSGHGDGAAPGAGN